MLEFETFYKRDPDYPVHGIPQEVTHEELAVFVEEKRLEGWTFVGVNGSGFLFSRNARSNTSNNKPV